ncbi:MAG: glycosyltransferase N-terminal domain-containing protein [Kiritimatiellia bacterium]
MKWFLYNLAFAVVYALMLPSFLLRMKRRGGYRARMGDRFGRYPAEIDPGEGAIWIHAVSVGEVFVAGQMMAALRAKKPDVRFIFSTTSSTGWRQAAKLVRTGDMLVYNPLDFRGCVRRALDRLHPRAVILTESEIWPNFIRELHARHIPVFLINARVSDRSAPRYRRLRWFFGEVLRCLTKIFAQSKLDGERLTAAGADPESVVVTGSFKFDVAHRDEPKERELRGWIGAGDILLGASTWPGEDEAMLRVYAALLRFRPDVKLVLAPRHFEKADAVESNIRKAGFACVRRSCDLVAMPSENPNVYLCDTTGELMGLFGIATVAFVGKSLCAHGSQNMIEPCLCGVPTLVGPYTENFRPVMHDLLSKGALVQVSGEAALTSEVIRLFNDPAARRELGTRAREAVLSRRGVVARCADELLAALREPAAYDVSVPPSCRTRRRRRFVLGTVLAALLAYLASCPFVVPRLNRAWDYLRMNASRRYAAFAGLSAATLVYPWCWPAARETCRTLRQREIAGTDEFGVTRHQATARLKVLLPEVFRPRKTVAFDARLASLADLKGVHDLMCEAGGGYWLWCVGRWDYLFVAKNGPEARPILSLDSFLDAFSERFDDFVSAGVYTPADLFASYMGDETTVAPALADISVWDRFLSAVLPLRQMFAPRPTGGCAPVVASHLMPRDLPTLDWIDRGGTDARVFLKFMERIDSVQVARRAVLLGLDAADLGASTNAIGKWAAAAKVNPRDPLLLGLLDSIDLEGRRFLKIGNLNGAIRCYENRLLIRPDDIAAVHNFGVCVMKAGHPDVAARVFARAVEMDPLADEHRLELVASCAASGHEDIACRQLDVLMKRHPDDPALMMRAARLLCLKSNAARDDSRAIALAESAVRITNWKDRAFVQALADVYIETGRVILGMGLKKKMKEMRFEK